MCGLILGPVRQNKRGQTAVENFMLPPTSLEQIIPELRDVGGRHFHRVPRVAVRLARGVHGRHQSFTARVATGTRRGEKKLTGHRDLVGADYFVLH